MSGVIISLSTIPPRFGAIRPVLESLLKQDVGPEEVRLYLPRKYRRFPDYDGSLPDVPKGVRIVRVADDLGPASKVLFAAEELRGEDCDIFYCDDDMILEKTRGSRLRAERAGRLDHCVAPWPGQIRIDNVLIPPARKPMPTFRRGNKLLFWGQQLQRTLHGRMIGVKQPRVWRRQVVRGGYANIALGVFGVLARPEFFDAAFYDIPPVLWSVDDYWISGHFARKGVPIWCGAGFQRPLAATGRQQAPLVSAVIDGANREEANAACVRYMQETYGVWRNEEAPDAGA